MLHHDFSDNMGISGKYVIASCLLHRLDIAWSNEFCCYDLHTSYGNTFSGCILEL